MNPIQNNFISPISYALQLQIKGLTFDESIRSDKCKQLAGHQDVRHHITSMTFAKDPILLSLNLHDMSRMRNGNV